MTRLCTALLTAALSFAVPMTAAHAQEPARPAPAPAMITLTFVNKMVVPAKILWIAPDGKRHTYAELKPGETLVQGTYVGHQWGATWGTGAMGLIAMQSREVVLDAVQAFRLVVRNETAEAVKVVKLVDGKSVELGILGVNQNLELSVIPGDFIGLVGSKSAVGQPVMKAGSLLYDTKGLWFIGADTR